MKKLIYLVSFIILIGGCAYNHKLISIQKSLYGNWFTKEQKRVDSKTTINITRKEQFFKNGKLISSKWFEVKDSSGKNLGEYYITKEFIYKKEPKYIKAKFIRCQTGITKPLKDDFGYQALSNACKKSLGSHKTTIKAYKIIGNKLILNSNNKKIIYTKED